MDQKIQFGATVNAGSLLPLRVLNVKTLPAVRRHLFASRTLLRQDPDRLRLRGDVDSNVSEKKVDEIYFFALRITASFTASEGKTVKDLRVKRKDA